MKKTKHFKKIAFGVLLITVCLCLSIATVYHFVHEQQLDELQNEALAELERAKGEYDEQSIVLSGTSKARAEELAKQFGAELRITEDGRYAKLTLPEGVTIRDVYAVKENRKYIEEMSADYKARISDLEEVEEENGERLPIRPQYTVTDADYDQQTYLDYLNMSNVWERYTGSGITVAVIDTGIDTDHPEFAGRISEYSYNATEDKIVKDWLNEDGTYDWSLIEDEQGHGTAVTGVIAANMNSGNIVGVAPNVTIITIKAECDENGNFQRTSDLVFGLYYAIERDVNVVNMSFGTYGPNPFAEATQLAYDSDIICVAAAGNDGTTALTYPAADPNVIGVGALGDGWELADYSNYGENSDLVAPGSTYTTLMGGTYGTMNGTSLASPIVTGAIALFLQNNPYVMFDDVAEVLYASCYDLGSLGNDWDYGFGALDLSAFLLEERGTVTFDMLTDELENEDALFIRGHALQELPEPERLYAVFDGWYYDDTFTQAVEYYTDAFEGDLTLYAKWANEEDGVPYTYVILDDGTVEIRSYTGHRRYITIPEKIEGRVVSSIGDFAFSGQERLREVGLPSGLTKIGRYAFENCANLISIEIPEGVKTIGEYAFSNNTRLSAVAFLGNSQLTTIGDFAFMSCGSLEKIELPASLKSVNGSAFYGATALHTINVQKGNTAFASIDGVLFNMTGSTLIAYPAAHGTSYTFSEQTTVIGDYAFVYAKVYTIDFANVVSIGGYAFDNASLKEVVIPDSVTSMGGSAFKNNFNLSSVTIGRGLTEISAEVFENCSALTEIVIPNGIRSIGEDAFFKSGLDTVTFEEESVLMYIGMNAFDVCSIREIDIPASVIVIDGSAFSSNPLVRVGIAENSELRTIEASAFANCGLLESIDFSDKLETIGNQAFAYSGLTAVTVPASVTTLGSGAFACCSGLTSIEVEEGNTVYHDIDGVVYNLDNTAIHAFPAGREATEYAIESTVRTVMPWSFAGTWGLGKVILPEGLTEVGEYGFYLCGATTYTLPTTLTNIMGYAFSANYNLSSIALPESLVQIAEGAFSSCTALRTIHIPDNVLQIGRYAFAGDWNLHSITFNKTSKLPRISFGAFAYTGITSFTVPANVSTMAQGAFMGCSKLTSFTFAEHSKLESISAYMFDGCTNLQSITFLPGSALTSIQAHGLEGMDNLTSIDFGDAKVTNVDNFAFRFCESLSTLTLPETVTNIGRYAFYGCKSLSELTIPTPVEHIGSYAFLGTNEIDLYFASDVLPAYLDENWDHSTRGYYVGVTSVATDGDFKYAVLTSGDIAIIEYLGSDTHVDLTTLDFGAPITAIGGSAFKDSTVTSIVLPETLTSIQAEAFQYCALESIEIPASVTFIGREAFAHTSIQSLTFGENSKLTVIEQYAFEGTENLKSVTLPASLTTMGTGAFLESGLEILIFENGIKLSEIPQRAFAETKITSVALPDSVTLVNHNAFNGVETLKSVSFGSNDGIRLMSNAFYQTGLTSLHIPANVTYIGEYCFVALPNLKEFTVDANNPNYTAVDGLLLNKSGRKLIAVPAGRTGSLTVPKSVEEIGFGAFEESKLSEILFHEDANILTFGYRAFFKAENITTISIPKSVISIDYYAFAYCKNLKTVDFAEGNLLKGIYEGAFLGCINLENITIPDTIVEISDFAFYGCSKIEKLPISENNVIKGIYDYAFAYTGLKGEFTTPATLNDIGSYAFLGTKLTKVTIPDTNKKILVIGIGAFEECNKLTEITLPFIGASYEDEEISWFGYIFGAGAYGANESYVPKSLKCVTITEGITNIYTGGFAYCTGLESINVPHSVSVLWNDAFANTTARYELTNIIMTYDRGWNLVYPYAANGHFGKGIVGKLQLAEGMTDIYSSTFYGCSSLMSITIPDSVTSIGNSAFSGCGSLISIDVSESNTAYCSYNGILYNKPVTSIIHVPEKITGNVVIPNGVTSIKESAFYGCNGLTSVSIPPSVITIEWRAFADCSGLTSIAIPDSVTSIGNAAFSGCSGLTSIAIPDSVTSIGYNAFYGCSGLTSVKIGNGMTSLDGFDFRNYTNLKNVVIGDGVISIGYTAFYDCRNLESITIGDGLTAIGELAFEGCSSLKSINVSKNNKAYCSYDGILYDKPLANIIYVPRKAAKNVVIPSGVTSINASAFSGNTNLTSITIPDSVTTIGERAFYGCNSLTSIKFGNGVVSIGDDAFWQCNNLTQVDITDIAGWCEIAHSSITSNPLFVGAELYLNGTLLTDLVIPDGVTTIGDWAFWGCSSLKSITIPDSVTSIVTSAFSECSNLTSIVVSKDNTTYCAYDGILYDNPVTQILYIPNQITGDVVIPNGVASIRDSGFSGCTGLTSITIPDSVTFIVSSAFSGCTGLISVTLPDSLTELPSGIFEGCTNLTSVTIPDSVTVIGWNAFQGCSNLMTVTIGSSVTSIGDNAFLGCSNLHEVKNLSNLVLSCGSWNNGYVAYYAKVILDKDGNRIYQGFGNNAEFIDTEDGFRFVKEGDIYKLVAYLGSEDTITLPDVFERHYYVYNFSGGKNVIIPDGITSIEWYAFRNCTSLISITLPDSLTALPSGIFEGCTSLTSVVIPDSVTSIGSNAFQNCTSLTSITIPNSVTSIGINAFQNCTSLTNITIPDGVTSIGSNAFQNCTSLNSITIPGSVTTIGNSAFSNCSNLISVTINDGVTLIDAGAFNECSRLMSIDIPDSVNTIGVRAFYQCSSLMSVTIPDSVILISPAAFQYCSNLVSVSIPDSVTKIGEYAFSDCKSLNSVTIPKSVTEIGYLAFSDCSSLTSVTIPNSVTSIEGNVFRNCTSLTSITIPNSVTMLGAEVFYGCSSLTNAIIGESVSSIGNSTFYGCSSLTSIVIPDSVTSIGNSAFDGCSNLSSIVIGNGVTSIGTRAFYGPAQLTSITFGNSVTEVGTWAFSGCSDQTCIYITDAGAWSGIQFNSYQCNPLYYGAVLYMNDEPLTEVVIPDGVTRISPAVFYGCSSLKSVVIPDSVISIGQEAFYGCTGLTSINIPDSVTTIEWYAFRGCSSLTSITIGDNVTAIGTWSFEGCSSLKSIYITNIAAWCSMINNANNPLLNQATLYSNGATLYLNDEPLTELVIPDGVTSIGSYAFSGCSGLISVTIPDSVTTIGDRAFSGCSGLISVTIPDSVTTIGDRAFSNCSGLTSITIPDSVTSINSGAFSGCSMLYEVYNYSSLALTIGSNEYGNIATYAKVIIDKDGNKTYRNPGSEFEYVDTQDGFRFIKQNDQYTLIAYLGSDDTITLPESINGNSYSISYFRGGKNVIIPDGITEINQSAFYYSSALKSVTISNSVTSIGEYAFFYCSNMTSITIPDSVNEIGRGAFQGCTALSNNPAYNEFGAMIIDGWLLGVNENVKYIPIQKIKHAAEQALDQNQLYYNAMQLKNPIWTLNGIYGATNAETIVVPHLTGIQLPSTSSMLTLKNIVLLDSVDIAELRTFPAFFKNISGVTIFVEASEEDLRWNDNFPGWNNGNRVIYGDQWTWLNFYDENGSLLYSAPRRNAEIIRQPIYEIEEDAQYIYEFVGWDLDGDGVADSIPATTIVDFNATAVYKRIVKSYNVVFKDEETGEIYYEATLPYGTVIIPPTPTKEDTFLKGWNGYTEGMIVTGDTEITADWHKHIFTYHLIEEPTCTKKGMQACVCIRCDYSTSKEIPATGHSYNAVAIASTCVEQGYTIHTCHCGESYVDSFVPATGVHIYYSVVTTPTCTEVGFTTYICSTCDDNYVVDEVAAVGHDLVVHFEQLPTCTEIGWNAYETCSRCNYSTYVELPGKGHSYGESVITLPSSCMFPGQTRRDCSICGHITYETLPLLQHNWNSVITAPTCTTEGYTTHSCRSCGMRYESDRVAALGHDMVSMDAKAPTCTEIGWEAHDACSRCDQSNRIEIPATGHSYTFVVTAPTCTEQGYTTHTCHCGDSYVDSYVPVTGHSYGNWVVTNAPTCLTVGEERRDCKNCDHYETREVAALGHNLVQHSAKAPTCTEIGWNAYETCSRCDHTTYVELPASGHSYDSVVTAPTCTEQGYTTHTCHCGDSYVDSYVAATGHSFGVWYETVAPKCETKGEERRDCDNCDHYETREVEALGHSLTQHDAKASTCTEIGWNAYETCSRCDHTTYVELPASGHSYDSVVTAPTCTEQGYTTHTCHCGDSYVDSYVAATGHSFGVWYETVAPKCETKGEERRDCANCDHYEIREVAALGHSLTQHPAKSPTCTEVGWNAYETCSRCDHTTYVELPASGHSYDSVVTAPTCTEQGYTTHTCHCGDSYVDSYVTATGHSFGVWYETVAPKCETKGEERRDCDNCDHYETREVEALGHSLTQHEAKSPTCTEIGWEAYETCSGCDHTTYVELPALGHSLTQHPAKAPTCTEIGWNAYETCSRCDHTTYVEIPAKGHSYTHTVVPPTTTSEGYTLHTCSVCGDSYKDNYVDQLTYIVGDTDGNETINKDDAIYLLMATFFPADYPLEQECDFDHSGEVNKDDAIYLLMYTFFPEDYPLTVDNPVGYALLPASKRDEDE